jgi:hypothetical protein
MTYNNHCQISFESICARPVFLVPCSRLHLKAVNLNNRQLFAFCVKPVNSASTTDPLIEMLTFGHTLSTKRRPFSIPAFAIKWRFGHLINMFTSQNNDIYILCGIII